VKFSLTHKPIKPGHVTRFDSDYIIEVRRTDGKGMGEMEALTACKCLVDPTFNKQKNTTRSKK